ncbi:MAG: type II toxin-antitoxin system HicB family antitoxin [Gammaproteobacteria bacterium]|nr:type II toxin-antitoxin system HicB family antitoxin [Gammaproteobacteria bacterium]
MSMRTWRQRADAPSIHAFVGESEGWCVAECREVAVVTQGRTLDETVANLRDALALHLDDDERARAGLPASPRLVVRFETSVLTA